MRTTGLAAIIATVMVGAAGVIAPVAGLFSTIFG